MPSVLPADLAAEMRSLRTRLDRLERQSVAPPANLAARKADDYVEVSSGSWATTWEVPIGCVPQTGIHWRSTVTSSALTTGEAKLTMILFDASLSAVETFETTAVAIPAADAVQVVYNWAPGWSTLDEDLYAILFLGVRRLTGGGSLFSLAPAACHFESGTALDATATGL
jgi:hypothetical protein